MAQVRCFTPGEASDDLLRDVRLLLEQAFAGDFSPDDWEHALGGWHVMAMADGVALAHAAVVPRVLEVGGRAWQAGYVEAVVTVTERQREGLGAAVMSEVGDVLRREFELGALATGRHAFYERLGWERWRGPTCARRDAETIRTEDDDDAVMVLRFGPSAEVDLTAPISCEARSGDHW